MRKLRVPAGVLALAYTGSTFAHSLSLEECTQGGGFIRNAALSRDYGISRAQFIDRLTDDIAMIQTFPPELRRFVQDENDEAFLRDASAWVFDTPLGPEQHDAAFVNECIQITVLGGDLGK